MPRLPIKRLAQIQKQMYDQAYQEASSLAYGSSQQIIEYGKKFEASIPEKTIPVSLEKIIRDIHQARLVLYGDFHTHRQSQRGFLRIVREYRKQFPSEKIVFALEMIRSKHQPFIDAYMSGQIDDETFLHKIEYSKSWGFPWPNFKMVLEFAQYHDIKVIGINTDLAGEDTLVKRDQHAARLLTKYLIEHPDEVLFSLIGEYHLANEYLPSSLTREMFKRNFSRPIVRIVPNPDKLYMYGFRDNPLVDTEYRMLGERFYAVINAPPWLKWQSFAFWEEITTSAFFFEGENDQSPDEIDEIEDGFDIDSHFLRLTRQIVKFFDLKLADTDLESFNIIYNLHGDFYGLLIQKFKLTEDEALRIIEHVSREGVFYLMKFRVILLTSLSINKLAYASGQFIFDLVSGCEDDMGMLATDFYTRAYKAAFGVLALKVMNPKVKVRGYAQIKDWLHFHAGRRLSGHAQIRRKVFKEVLNLLEKLETGRAFTSKQRFRYLPIYEQDLDWSYEASYSLGMILGLKLYENMFLESKDLKVIKHLLGVDLAEDTLVIDSLKSILEAKNRKKASA